MSHMHCVKLETPGGGLMYYWQRCQFNFHYSFIYLHNKLIKLKVL